MPSIVDCGHCGGAGHRAGSPCCYMVMGMAEVQEAVKLANENPEVLVLCCCCRGSGKVVLKDPAPTP